MISLFDPLSFQSGLTIKNRIALAPMTNLQSHEDGSLGEDELRFLTMRAKGGFGLIETCAAHVAKDGQGWVGELGIFDDALLPGLTKLATSLRENGAASFVQIFHGGLRADPALSGSTPWSASASTDPAARQATTEDIARVISEFGAAAERAEKAGFDGVEIHGAHGYVITQFLSTTQNRRTDSWGGSLEGRARLAREITREVRRRTKSSFTVGIRLSPEDFGNARGLDLDETLEVAKELAVDGVDFIHASLWRAQENTKKRPHSHAVSLLRDVLPPHVKIFVAGEIWTKRDAQALLERGADVVALGRAGIVNPSWPLDVAKDGWEPDRPPVAAEQLSERGLGEPFVDYMRARKGFVA